MTVVKPVNTGGTLVPPVSHPNRIWLISSALLIGGTPGEFVEGHTKNSWLKTNLNRMTSGSQQNFLIFFSFDHRHLT